MIRAVMLGLLVLTGCQSEEEKAREEAMAARESADNAALSCEEGRANYAYLQSLRASMGQKARQPGDPDGEELCRIADEMSNWASEKEAALK